MELVVAERVLKLEKLDGPTVTFMSHVFLARPVDPMPQRLVGLVEVLSGKVLATRARLECLT